MGPLQSNVSNSKVGGGQQGVESQQRQPKSDFWNAPPGHPLRVYSWRRRQLCLFMAAGGGPRVGANVARRAALGSRQSVRYRSAGRIERLAAHGLRDVRDGGACFFGTTGSPLRLPAMSASGLRVLLLYVCFFDKAFGAKRARTCNLSDAHVFHKVRSDLITHHANSYDSFSR